MELLKRLTGACSVSGAEESIREILIKESRDRGFDVHTDALGNVIARKKGKGARVMAAAHMDEIGVMVSHIDKNGFLRFSAVGGLNTKNLVGLKIRFNNGITGVIGCESEDEIKAEKLFADIGASDAADAERHVSIGDTAAFVGDMYQNGDTIISKALDNRAGCYILLRAMEKLKCDKDLYFVFTVQEEVGLRGAGAAAFAIKPDWAIAVDVTDTGDTPGAPVSAVKLGGGAAVKIMDHSVLCDVRLRTEMTKAAKKRGIPWQPEIMADGGTDAGAIQLTRAGVRTGGISLPVRYIHSPSETARMSDIRACTDLLCAAIEDL